MVIDKELEKLLIMVEKPGRYIGGELNTYKKDTEKVATRFGFAFPDTYEIGMSYLGLQIIYHILNKQENIFCERVFAPAIDMEKLLRKNSLPLFTIETKTPICDLDILGFTLQYELSYTNIINMLNLGNIPLLSEERNSSHPFIAAGGPCAFNPEPIADFIDFFMLGDGEEVLVEVCNAHEKWKNSNNDRDSFLKDISKIEGIYVPKFYEPKYNEDGTISSFEKKYEDAKDVVVKRIVEDLDKVDFPEKTIVPFIETVHDRAVIEIFRGCTRGCRFCQAGMIYRPVRERSKSVIEELAKKQLKNSGHEEMSILSLSTSDYSEIEPLVEDLMSVCKENNVSMSLPSLRLDSFSFKILKEIQGYKKSGLTFAPEAGTQRLRDVINKSITEDDIYNSVEKAIELGWSNIKLYFMIGLPTETYEDLDGIVEIAKKITDINYKVTGKRGGRFNVTVSISNFVPKAHTPFQWVKQNSSAEFREKHSYLRDKFKSVKGVSFNYHGSNTSHMEAVFARGDRRLSALLIKAFELGCKFDGWSEHFNYNLWLKAFEETNIDPDFYTTREFKIDEVLPWDIISCGVSKEYFIDEYNKAISKETTQDCRKGCTGCGINNITTCKMEGTL